MKANLKENGLTPHPPQYLTMPSLFHPWSTLYDFYLTMRLKTLFFFVDASHDTKKKIKPCYLEFQNETFRICIMTQHSLFIMYIPLLIQLLISFGILYCPVIIMRKMSDLCWTCQHNSTTIMRTANKPDTEKSATILAAQEHFLLVQLERSYYKTFCVTCRQQIRRSLLLQ